MTTGSTSLDQVVANRGGVDLHWVRSKTWSGGDSSPALRPTKGPKRVRHLPPHDYHVTGKNYQQDWFEYGWGESQRIEYGLLNEIPVYNVWDEKDDLRAIDKLRAEVYGSQFNPTITVGEGRKSLNSIASAATRIAKSATLLNYRQPFKAFMALGNHTPQRWKDWSVLSEFDRDAKIRQYVKGHRTIRSTAEELASLRLELQYAWRPLLKDIADGAAYCATNFNAPLATRVNSTTSARSLGRTSTGSAIVRHNYYPLYWGGWLYCDVEVSSSKRLIATVREKNVEQLLVADLPGAIWEFVPYSFVADWLVPIGGWLRARGLNHALEASYVVCSRNVNEVVSWGLDSSGALVSYYFTRRPAQFQWRRYDFERVVSADLPIPGLFSLGKLSDVPSWSHATDAIALAINALKGR